MVCDNTYENKQINNKWQYVKNIRKVATGSIEKIREEKVIRSSLEAHLAIYLARIYEIVKDVKFDEITITSSFELHQINIESKGFQ